MRPIPPVPGLALGLTILGIVLVVLAGPAAIIFLAGILLFRSFVPGLLALYCLIVAGVGVALMLVGRRALRAG